MWSKSRPTTNRPPQCGHKRIMRAIYHSLRAALILFGGLTSVPHVSYAPPMVTWLLALALLALAGCTDAERVRADHAETLYPVSFRACLDRGECR